MGEIAGPKRPAWIRAAATAIRRLGPADLPGCQQLAADRGWISDPLRWRLLLRTSTVYGIEEPGGAIVGTVALTRYGPGTAVIGMMLVALRHGGQGLGRQLMTHALREAGDRTVLLYATEYGRPLYEKLGFTPVTTVTAHTGRFMPTDGDTRAGATRQAVDADLAAVAATDAEVFGADRAGLLRLLFTHAAQTRVAERDGNVTGYAIVWGNHAGLQLGPVIAADPAAARTLIAGVAADVDAPVRLDLDDRDPALRAWAADRGLAPTASTTLMVFDGRDLPGDRSRLFAPGGMSFG